MQLQYDKRSAAYRDLKTGRYVSRDRVLEVVEAQSTALQGRLRNLVNQGLSGKINAATLTTQFIQEIKVHAIQNVAIASGGIDRLNNKAYGGIGQFTKEQAKRVRGFVENLTLGTLSEKQALARADLYGDSIRSIFYWAEKNAHIAAGQTFAKRLLSAAEHCAECLSYHTPEWTAIENIVPPGVNCSCRGRCKCTILYKV